jgi:hypothetical protein
MSLFEIKCPLCKGTLWIDPATGKVVDHKAIDQKKANFDDFLKSRQKGTAWDDKMKKAKEDEVKRKAEIEQQFKSAKDSKEVIPDGPFHTPLDWD